jgi:peptide/nickel transport system permease protein
LNARVRIGLIVVGALVLFALIGPIASPQDPSVSRFDLGRDAFGNPTPPNAMFWLGTDVIFRDQFTRLALGARVSLFIGLSATLIAAVVGGVIGILSGYYEGTQGIRIPWLGSALFVVFVASGSLWVLAAATVATAASLSSRFAKRFPFERSNVSADGALGVLIDVGLSFPFLLLVMAIAASFEKASMLTILLTLGLTSWLGIARVVRAKTLEVRSREFVIAAQALGQSTPRIMLAHIFPNVRTALLAIATLSVGPMIVAESVLSYLGVGLAPPTPTWGHMLQEGQDMLGSAPWLFFAPSALILLTTLGFNMLGEGLRNADA